METLKIAIAKGRLAKYSIELLEEIGIDCQVLKEDSRKLVFTLPQHHIEVILLKAVDVPTYVEHGVVDMGIVGKDVLMEQERQLYEVVDLKFGVCKFSVAGRPNGTNGKKHLRVATKYPNVTKKYFAQKGQSVEVIRQEGSVELAPLMGLSDVIVDIVETGKTLKENGLVVLEDIANISARLVLNKVSYKTKKKEITTIIDLIAEKVS
ncbi:ATP phosphoribosyltransferase catalytic subunit [Natronincola peptidivorans]|uniref:ATP phosphoribosyltransferase n=1 Tax=Natronincola peptidivorans TaxID=426128 RepID=A0A1H9ZJS7_9FIRM|nr:ATP phosphoribosyltransferase [Natronincola peptidivorans]SES81764.1 ATP phosphoribosyltransferase catalytic subunit [Natronincola peptidivorans]